MSFESKRKFSMVLSSAYFGISALSMLYVVGYHANISCSGVVLLLCCAPLALYSLLFQHSLKNNGHSSEFLDPADYGMSIGTAKLIRAFGLIIPLPFLAYGAFFASGLSYFALDGSAASIARTYDVISIDERIFGHRMAQREYIRAARMYKWKANYGLAKMFIGSAIQCAEEHTPDKPGRLVDYHREAARVAMRAHHWEAADCELSAALQIARETMKLGDEDRTVRRLTRWINRLHARHPELSSR